MENSPSKLKSLICLARPRHWVKNLLVLAPLFFGLKLADRILLMQAVAAFIAFSLAASAVYHAGYSTYPRIHIQKDETVNG
ncbi:MAG: hypothetical protein GXO70_08345 [Acidobacteria bacterium]|nr:hypothetical protein [Acidobacteriota bacterium]